MEPITDIVNLEMKNDKEIHGLQNNVVGWTQKVCLLCFDDKLRPLATT